MKRFTLALSSLTLVAAVFGVVAGPETAGAAAKAPTAPSEADPAPAMAAAGLCGMTQAEVQSIVDDYEFEPQAGWVAAALQQPFNCSAYGDLCEVLGPQDAHTYACNVWTALGDRIALGVISTEALDYIDEHGVRCSPDEDECAEECDELGKPVRECLGTISVLDGSCITVTWCSSLRQVLGFEHFLVRSL